VIIYDYELTIQQFKKVG